MHGASCVPKVHRNGSVTYAPQMVGAAIIHPDVRAVMPLRPAPIGQHDGTDNNDGERHAATRLGITRRQDHPPLTCIVTADSLSSHAPPIATLPHHALHSLLGVKAGDHPFLFQQVQVAEYAGRVTSDERHDRAAGVLQRLRFVKAVPLKASNVEVRVHGIESWELGDAKVQHCRWGTDLRVSTRNILHLMRGGRARWKIANATFHTLHNQGDHVAHTDGPGEQHLSVVCARLRMLALLVDQPPQLCCALLQAVWAKLGRKRLLWERMRALLYDEALASMRQLCEALLDGFKKAGPMVTMDSSSFPSPILCHRVREAGDTALGGAATPSA
jgi:hypothetical protein